MNESNGVVTRRQSFDLRFRKGIPDRSILRVDGTGGSLDAHRLVDLSEFELDVEDDH